MKLIIASEGDSFFFVKKLYICSGTKGNKHNIKRSIFIKIMRQCIV